MNSTIESIMNRHSIRFYSDEKVSREDLETIINAGNAAPTGSGGNWRFVVVSDSDKISEMSRTTVPYYEGFMEHAPEVFRSVRKEIDAVVSDPIYYSAPAVVFVISGSHTSDYDCSMVCQNMMLAANSMNLGSCWVYFGQMAAEHPVFSEMLRLQEGEKIYGPIILGHPAAQQPPTAPRSEPKTEWF